MHCVMWREKHATHCQLSTNKLLAIFSSMQTWCATSDTFLEKNNDHAVHDSEIYKLAFVCSNVINYLTSFQYIIALF